MPVGALRLSFSKVLDSYVTELNETLWLKELMQLPKVPNFLSLLVSAKCPKTTSPFENDTFPDGLLGSRRFAFNSGS